MPKIQWYEPKWAYVPEMWRQLFLILNVRSLAKVLAVSFFVGALIVGGLRWAIPQIAFPDLWKMIFVLPGLILALVLHCGLMSLFSPTVIVREDRITIHHGETNETIDSSSITAIKLTFHSDDRIRLGIHYKGRYKKIGIPPEVDFDKLMEVLPVEVTVRDARKR